MWRNEARRRFTLEDHARMTAGEECRKDVDVIDETPAGTSRSTRSWRRGPGFRQFELRIGQNAVPRFTQKTCNYISFLFNRLQRTIEKRRHCRDASPGEGAILWVVAEHAPLTS